MWLFRLGGTGKPPAALFPADLNISDLEAQFSDMHSAWTDFLAGLSDRDLERVFEYRRTEGDQYRNSVEDTLTQLHGHAIYHRGQIATLLRRMGFQPAATDFIFWARQAG
jgi:uncharacterized damage-inducible protein DinB